MYNIYIPISCTDYNRKNTKLSKLELILIGEYVTGFNNIHMNNIFMRGMIGDRIVGFDWIKKIKIIII